MEAISVRICPEIFRTIPWRPLPHFIDIEKGVNQHSFLFRHEKNFWQFLAFQRETPLRSRRCSLQ